MATEQDIFISKIHIKNIRHLKDIDIPISTETRKHLILTGKNGSGKTSTLRALQQYLSSVERNEFEELIRNWNKSIEHSKEYIGKLRNDLLREKENKHYLKQAIKAHERTIIHLQKDLAKYASSLDLEFSYFENIDELYKNGNFIISYFDAKRLSKSKAPNGITKFNFKKAYKSNENANENFIQHIVNLKADKSFANDDNEIEVVQAIDNWFNRLENALKQLFEDQTLELKFDRKNYTFNILSKGKKPFTFNELSDGYSAVLHIITELIMRMEGKNVKSYNIQGIVLIDEIEAHLHIALQKQILPFLTAFFPKIQFIVTTHSPFVLSSIENAVIYDLENRISADNLSGLSYDGLVESYFLADKYSSILKEKVNEYEQLLNQSSLSDEENSRLFFLEQYFNELPKFSAPELQVKLQQLRFAKLDV